MNASDCKKMHNSLVRRDRGPDIWIDACLQNPTEWMVRVLAHSGAYFSAGRRDMKYQITQKDQRADDPAPSTETRTQKKQKKTADLDESVLVASALIATVTFAAAFTMPGSYKTDGDREGTLALASRYGFKVFVIADILAFYCSVAATFSLAEYSNRDDVDPLVRRIYAQRAVRFFHVALKSVIVAFALGVIVVMWDISLVTVVIVAVATSALVLYGNEALAHDLRFMRVMYRRFGFSRAWRLYPSTSSHLDWNNWRLRSFFATLAWNIAKLFGTYIFIFLVAYIAQLKQKSGI